VGLAGAGGGIEGCRHRRLGGSQLSSHRYTGDGERMPAEPVQLPEREPGLGESRSRPDYDAALLRLKTLHVERLCRGNPEPFSLADGEMGNAAMAPQHMTPQVDDVTRLAGLRPQPLDEQRVGALR